MLLLTNLHLYIIPLFTSLSPSPSIHILVGKACSNRAGEKWREDHRRRRHSPRKSQHSKTTTAFSIRWCSHPVFLHGRTSRSPRGSSQIRRHTSKIQPSSPTASTRTRYLAVAVEVKVLLRRVIVVYIWSHRKQVRCITWWWCLYWRMMIRGWCNHRRRSRSPSITPSIHRPYVN